MVCQDYLLVLSADVNLSFLLLFCVNEVFTSCSYSIWSTLLFQGLQSLQHPSIHREWSCTPRSVPSHGLHPSPAPSGDRASWDHAGFTRLSVGVGKRAIHGIQPQDLLRKELAIRTYATHA